MTALLFHMETTNRKPPATLNRPYYNLSKSYGHMVSESTGIVNVGYYPSLSIRVCMTVICDYHKFHTIGQSGFHADASHHLDFGEQYIDSKLYMSQ